MANVKPFVTLVASVKAFVTLVVNVKVLGMLVANVKASVTVVGLCYTSCQAGGKFHKKICVDGCLLDSRRDAPVFLLLAMAVQNP